MWASRDYWVHLRHRYVTSSPEDEDRRILDRLGAGQVPAYVAEHMESDNSEDSRRALKVLFTSSNSFILTMEMDINIEHSVRRPPKPFFERRRSTPLHHHTD